MVLTAAARDGGLREDSLKLFVFLVHPSTMQRYDRHVLAKDWDQARKKALETEKLHFLAIQSGELSKQKTSKWRPDKVEWVANFRISKS